MEDAINRGHEWFVLVYELPSEPIRYRASPPAERGGGASGRYGSQAGDAHPGDPRVRRYSLPPERRRGTPSTHSRLQCR